MHRSVVAAVPLAVLALAGGYLLVGTAGPAPATAAASASPGPDQGVVVTGLGRVSGVPDVLRATLGVDVHGHDVTGTLAAANAAQSRVLTAVRRDGVADKDVQTSDVSLNQSYDGHGVPNGYQVSERVTVKLRDLHAAGKALGDAVQAGGRDARLEGVSFDLEDNAALLAAARDAAYAEAKAKAQKYADLSGRALGPVQLVSEVQSDAPPVQFAADRTSLSPVAGALSVPLSPGQSEVSVTVTVRWSFA